MRHISARPETLAPRGVVDVVAIVGEVHRIVDVLGRIVIGRAFRPRRNERDIRLFELHGEHTSRRAQLWHTGGHGRAVDQLAILIDPEPLLGDVDQNHLPAVIGYATIRVGSSRGEPTGGAAGGGGPPPCFTVGARYFTGVAVGVGLCVAVGAAVAVDVAVYVAVGADCTTGFSGVGAGALR